MSKETTNRRNFIKKTGLVLGGVGAAGIASANPFSSMLEEEVIETGKMVKLLSTSGEVVEIDKAYLKPVPETYNPVDDRVGIEGRKFVMVIDLSKCKNLKKCRSVCNKMHHLNANQNWVSIYPMQDSEQTAPYWQPTVCMHCDKPPCVKVCPVDATLKRKDGIVSIDNDRCIGCRFCMAACPYSARVFNWYEPEKTAENTSIEKNTHPDFQQKGTVGKCDFCPDMLDKGMLPSCVNACPNGVFYFGDMNDDTITNGAETVRFSEMIKDKAGYRLMEDLGTKPSVYYLPPANRIFPYEEGLENEE